MKIKISYAVEGCWTEFLPPIEDEAQYSEELLEKMASTARAVGLRYAGATDYGAEWEGDEAQITRAKAALPLWADVNEVEE